MMPRLLVPTLALASSLCAQSPFVCETNTGSPPLVRSEGTAELAGDIILSCTGGTPAAAGQAISQANFTLFFNTNITTNVLAGQFTEALLIVDEPSSPVNPTRPVLNCGNAGAPDSGVSGPGVCSSVSTGNPALSYDGTPNGYGGASCDGGGGRPAANSYTCGRPNVFQGQLGSPQLPDALNAVTFSGVPVDPPGATTTRTFRFTNLRVNAALVGFSGNFSALNFIQTQVSVNGNTMMSINNPQQTVGYVVSDLAVGASCGTGAAVPASRVRVCEGFQYAWKPKNISFEVGNGAVAGNGTLTSGFNGGTNYPPDVAQNVAGAIYYSESGFEWQNNAANGPPSPNPPPGTDFASVTVTTAPLSSAGYGGLNTGINLAGVAAAGTRIAFQFSNIPQGGTVQVPPVLYLFSGTSGYNGNPTQYQAAATGVMVLTATDLDGNGAFNPSAATTLTAANNLAVYEILWADPFALEFTELPYTPMGAAVGANLQIGIGYAPFYSDSISQQATNSRPVPRFVASVNLCVGPTCSQSIAFGPLSNQAFGAAPFMIAASASSELPVSFNSLTPAVCSVSDTTVTLVGVGTCTIQATQPGNANYTAAAPVSQSFTVTAGGATHLSVAAPSTATQGVPIQFTVTALDANNNIVLGFTDPVSFGSSGAASLPGNMTLTNGVGVFSATFATIGSQTITATDSLNSVITGTSAPISVAGCTNEGANFNPSATTISLGTFCFQAGTSITVNSGFVVNGTASVTFLAGSRITLGPGFEANGTAGATFVAYVP